jgi:hypothetical protein
MSRYVPNPRLAAELAAAPEIHRARVDAARQAAEHAQRLSPRGPGRGPHFADSLRVADDGDDVRVESTDPFAHIIEFGSVNNPPYAPLRRGVRAAGLRLSDT